MRKLFVLLFMLYASASYAWDATGHRLIAQIAYERLTPAAKIKVDQLTKIMDAKYPPSTRFLYAAVWPDTLRADGVTAFNTWHFIDYPYSADHSKVQSYRPDNVVWAIQQSEQALKNTQTNAYEKAVFVRFLLHLVGDIHQPLHCINRYRKQFPQGDSSGNLILIVDNYAQNLHMYWDEGLGLFRQGNDYPLESPEVKQLARQITENYPPKYFGNKALDLDPLHWSKQGYQIAINSVYNIENNSKPSVNYNTEGQRIVAQQIALAGYRLANVLNQIFTN